MRKKLFVCLVMAAGMAGATEPVAFRASARVEIDAAGKPMNIEASKDLPDSIRTFIEKTVATWHFTPPSRGDVSGIGVTYLSLGACAFPEGGNYRMAIDLKGNGPSLVSHPEPSLPRYPSEAMRAGREADLVVKWIVETDGLASLERIERKGGTALRKNDPFFKPIKEWIAQLRYEPEELAGHRVRTRISMPFKFSLLPRRSTTQTENQKEMNGLMQSPECQIAASRLGEDMHAVAVDSPVSIEVP